MTLRARIPHASRAGVSSAQVHNFRRRRQRRPGQVLFVGELGGNSGRVEDSTQNDLKLVREVQNTDTDGTQLFGEPILVRSSTLGAHTVGYGTRVKVGYDFDGELAVLGADYKSMVQSGTNPAVLNSADPRTQTFDTNNLPQLLCYAVADADNDTLSVAVNPFVYRDYLGEFQVYNGGQVDLTSYVPSTTGTHVLVGLFLNQVDNTIAVHSSTEKAQTQTLTHATDLAEIYDAAPTYAIPIKGWRLIEGQTTILGSTLWDLRPLISAAQTIGFPNLVDHVTHIPAGVSETFHGALTVTSTLTVAGTLTVVDDAQPVIDKTEITTGYLTVGETNHLISDTSGNTFWSGGGGLIRGNMTIPGVDIVVSITDGNPTEVFDDGTTSAGDGWATGIVNQVTFPTGGDEHYLALTIPGSYRITWDMSFNMAAPGANIEVHGGLMIDGVATRNAGETHRTIANNSDTGNMGSTTEIDCPNGTEQISLWVLNADNNQNVTVEHGNLNIELVGGT